MCTQTQKHNLRRYTHTHKCAQRCCNTHKWLNSFWSSFRDKLVYKRSLTSSNSATLIENLCVTNSVTEFNFGQQLNILNPIVKLIWGLFFFLPFLCPRLSLSLARHISFPASCSAKRKEKKEPAAKWPSGDGGRPGEFSDTTDLCRVQSQLWSDVAGGDWRGRRNKFWAPFPCKGANVWPKTDKFSDGCWQINPWNNVTNKDLREGKILRVIKETACTRERANQKLLL